MTLRAIAIVAAVACAAAGCGGGGEDALLNALRGAKSAEGISKTLKSIEQGNYAEKQLTGIFCASATNYYSRGKALPTDWSSFALSRVGVSTGNPIEDKAKQLEAALEMAQQNPRLASYYVKGCGLLKP